MIMLKHQRPTDATPFGKTGKRSSFQRMLSVVSKKNDTKEQQKSFRTIGGVYATEIGDASEKQDSFKSLSTVDTRSSEGSTGSWKSSGSSTHHKGAPLVAKNSLSMRRINPEGIDLGDAEILGRIMVKSRNLPRNNGYYASNHVMINNERTKRTMPPLKRMPAMDELAREQARKMAEKNELFHADTADLQEQLGRQCGRRIGENVTRGANLQSIHTTIMIDSRADRNNVLDRRFAFMGVGTAKAADGTLYLCQHFRD